MDELLKQPAYANIEFLRLNFDTEDAFKRRYKVPVRSVILLFKGGREVDRITANGDKAVIEGLLKKAI